MRRLKKVIAALLTGVLVIGSVGIIPAKAAVTGEGKECDVLLKQDFDAENSMTESGVNPNAEGVCEWKKDTETGDGYLFLNSSTAADTFIGIGFSNAYNESGTIWIEMDVQAVSGSDAQPWWFGVDAYGEKASSTYGTLLAGYNQLYISKNWSASDGLGKLNRTDEHRLSYKIDLVSDKFTAYVDGVEKYSGNYTQPVCQSLRITISKHSTNGAAKGFNIDNLAVYACEEQVDIFAKPTGITLDQKKVPIAVGDTVQLTETVETTGIIPEVIWKSDNEDVATVVDGLVTAVGKGQATITAKAGDVQATCVVMVGMADVLLKQDFDKENSMTDSGLTLSAEGVCEWKQDTETGDGYLFLNSSTSADTFISVGFPNDYNESGPIWIEMDVQAISGSASQPWYFGVDAYGEKASSTYATQLAGYKELYISNNWSTSAGLGRLDRTYEYRLSYKIDLVKGEFTAYVDGVEKYSGNYTQPVCQALRITISKHSTNGATKGFNIDNLAVYATDTQFDFFAKPTGITLNQKRASISVGDEVQLTETVETAGIIPEVTWESDNEDVATVVDGLVTAVGKGQATITAKTGDVQATCVVMVGMAAVLLKEDFDTENVVGNGFTPDINVDDIGTCVWKRDEATGDGYLFLNTSNVDHNYVGTSFPNDYNGNAIIWIEMDIYVESNSILRPYAFQVDAFGEKYSNSYKHSVANYKQLWISNSAANTDQGYGQLSKGVDHRLSYKIDLVNGKFTAYVDGTETYSGDYTEKVCKHVRVTMGWHSSENRETEGVRIDNLAVYATDTQFDFLAKPTGITLDQNKVSLPSVGDTVQLTATVETTGIIPEVTWKSDNENVAIVTNGLVTAVGNGKATITVTAGDVTATCVIIVGKVDVLLKETFDTKNVVGNGFTPDSNNDGTCVWKKDEVTGDGYLFLNTSRWSSNYVGISFPNDYNGNAIIWIDMDIYVESDSNERPYAFQVDAFGETYSDSYKHSIADYKQLWISNSAASTDQGYGRLSRGVDHRLSYKIDLVNGKFTAYVDGAETYSGEYKEEVCKYVRVTMGWNFINNRETEGVRIDNFAVYACEEQVDVFEPEIKGTTLSLDGNISIDFYIDLGRYVGNKSAYVTFTLPDENKKQIKFTEAKKDTDTGYYVFSCEVAAKEMTEDITVEIHEGDRQLIETVSYTVYQNATYIIDNASTNAKYSEAKSLAEALLNYGAYAQLRFKYNTSDLANKKCVDVTIGTVAEAEMADLATYAYDPTTGTSGIGTVAGASLSLNSETALNFYFLLETDVQNLTFTCGGEVLNSVKSGNMYYVKVDNISATNLDKPYTVVVTDNNGDTLSASYSALAYVYNVLNLDDGSKGYGDVSALKKVVHALYRYNRAAEEYFELINRVDVLYYNDYENLERVANDGISIDGSTATANVSQLVAGETNNYVKLSYDTNAYCAFQAKTEGAMLTDTVIIQLSLSTDSRVVPTAHLSYPYDRNTTNPNYRQYFFSIKGDGSVVVDSVSEGTETTVANLEKGKWVNIGIKFKPSSGRYTVSVFDDTSGTWVYMATNVLEASLIPPIWMRLQINETNANVGRSLLFDNFAVYTGNNFKELSTLEVVDPNKATIGADVEMDYPELSDIGDDGIAVMAGKNFAYVGGEKVFINTDALKTDTDIMVSGEFIQQYLNVTVKDTTEQYAIGEIAKENGKNVIYDERGLLVITNPDIKLDAEEDVRLLTLIYGLFETGELVSNYAAAPIYTQKTIDNAIDTQVAGFPKIFVSHDATTKSVSALYYLTLIARDYPDAKHSTKNITVVDSSLERLRACIRGGSEPYASAWCDWGHAMFSSALTLVKNTDVIYSKLTDEEKGRMDTIMATIAISCNWAYNDANNYSTGFNMMGGLYEQANYRNANLPMIVNAWMYFGAEKLDEIFVNFDYDIYMAKFEEYGFTNIYEVWSEIGYDNAKKMFEEGGDAYLTSYLGDYSHANVGTYAGTGQGVKLPFSYEGYGAEDMLHIFSEYLIAYTYQWQVISEYGTPGLANHCYIISDNKVSPMQGQMGMMTEYATTDSGGIRSRSNYCYYSWQVLVTLYSNMKLFGGWDSSTKRMREMDNRIWVGNEDLIYKLTEGYHGYSIGESYNEYEKTFTRYGYEFLKDIWYNFHCMQYRKTIIR